MQIIYSLLFFILLLSSLIVGIRNLAKSKKIFIGSETGTYTFGDLNLASAVIGGNTFTTMFSDNPTGAIVITKYDMTNKKISGTFTFSGDNMDGDVFEVTEGKFENVDLVVM